MQSKKILILTTAIFFTPLLTSASGLSVSPTRLDFVIKDKTAVPKIQEIIIANPTTETVIMEIVPDNFAGLIIPAPQIFSLAPGGRKTVFITLAQNYEKFFFSANKIKTNLSIVAKPLNGGNFSVMSGVKLPVNIKLIQSNQPARQKQAIGLTALFILLIVWLWKKYKTPRH